MKIALTSTKVTSFYHCTLNGVAGFLSIVTPTAYFLYVQVNRI
ncbi:hypothetical protein J2Z65_007102 [Paenibacillus aceris]|uniref:Uncharacterized protein n=1 Tax=Paenibacillus aceris TaxID=869555 RepID=A0ABS4IAW1_9BACL|nr:hypothetical protein [Paenibacillus aceris]